MTRSAQALVEHRHVEALDRGDPLDVAVDEVGEAVQELARAPRAPRAAQAANASAAAPTAAAASAGVAARDVGRACSDQSSGERSSKVAARGDALAADVVVESRRDAADDVDAGSRLEPGRDARARAAGRASVGSRPALAAVLPVAAEGRRADLLGLGGLRADLVADRRGAVDDVVGQRAEALDLDGDDVARLDRAATRRACPRG